MKYYTILFLFACQLAFAQSYYPSSVGNEWFFDSSSTSFDIKVVSDSLFPNGHHYSVLNRYDFVYGQYVRVDSQYVYYYDSNGQKEIPFFKLNGKKGDTTYAGFSRIVITGIDTVTMFNTKTRMIHYRIDDLQLREIALSDKFGLVSASLYSDPPPPWPDFVYNVVGCIIDGTKYGYTLAAKYIQYPPHDFTLFQNYPNPFNPITTIEYSLSTSDFVQLKITDCLGREISTLVSEKLSNGKHQAKWNAGSIASGVYYYRLSVGNKSEIKRLVLMR